MAIKDFITKGNAQMAGDITVGGYLAGPATLVIDPAAVAVSYTHLTLPTKRIV